MKKAFDILHFDLPMLMEAVRLGHVARRQQVDLHVFNYTQRVQWEGPWNPVTRQARGLILRLEQDEIAEIAALPFKKFFGWNEPDVTLPPGEPEVTVKHDGALGICYRQYGKLRWATRGSFSSDQAHIANSIWQEKFSRVEHLVPENLTLLVEIIHPETRVVVNYEGASDLVLIGARDRFTGDDYEHDRLLLLGDLLGMTVVQRVPFHHPEILLKLHEPSSAVKEGFVFRWPDGYRVKVKTEEYVRLHRIVTGISVRAIVESWMNGDPIVVLYAGAEEFANDARRIYDELNAEEHRYWSRVHNYLAFAPGPSVSQKEFAFWVQEHVDPEYRPACYALRVGKSFDARKHLARQWLVRNRSN